MNVFRALRGASLDSLLLAVALSSVCSLDAFAQASPNLFNFEGTLANSSGVAIPSSNVNFTIEIKSPNADACLLFSETHTGVDLSQTSGQFNLLIGTGTRTDGGAHSFEDVFANSFDFPPTLTCASGNDYTPAASDSRFVLVTVEDIAGGTSAETLPAISMGTSPFSLHASHASKVGGKSAAELIQVNDGAGQELNQANIDGIFSTTNYNELLSLLAGTSSLYLRSTPVAAVNMGGQVVNNVASPVTGTDAVNKTYSDGKIGGTNASISGVSGAAGDGKLLTWNQSSSQWEATDPSFSGTAISSGTIDKDRLPTTINTVIMSGKIDANGENIENVGHMTFNPQFSLRFGHYTTAQESAFVGGLSTGQEGTTWYNSDTEKVMYWDGTAAVVVGSGGADNLGNHTATQSLDLAGFKLVGGGGTQGIQIDSSGRVGVGVSPTTGQNLQVFGGMKLTGNIAAETAASAAFIDNNNGTTRFFSQGQNTTTRGGYEFMIRESDQANELKPLIIQNDGDVSLAQVSGNVGIGTGSPATSLHIEDATTPTLRIKESGASDGADINHDGSDLSIINRRAAGSIFLDTTGSSSSIRFFTSANEKMRIKNDGTIGIGTTSPSGKLDIEGGDVFIGTGTLTNSTGSEDLSVTGNVEVDGAIHGSGAGLTNIPGTAIDAGTVSVSQLDFASVNGIGIPQVSGNPGSPSEGQLWYNQTTDKMTYRDGSADLTLATELNDLSDVVSTADSVYVGTNSGSAGTNNTALGSGSFATIATGSDNIAIGKDAIGAPAAGTVNRNTVVGVGAGTSLNGADNNILIGFGTGSTMDTGDRNILIGHDVEPHTDPGGNNSQNALNIGNIIFGININQTGNGVDTDARIGIGTANPATDFEVSRNDQDARLRVATYNGLSTEDHPGVDVVNYSDHNESDNTFRGARARGTVASPGSVIQNDNLVSLVGFGQFGAGVNDISEGAEISIHADDTYSSGDTPGYIKFATTPDGSSALSERMRITADGKVGVGTASPTGVIHVDTSGTEVAAKLTQRGDAATVNVLDVERFRVSGTPAQDDGVAMRFRMQGQDSSSVAISQVVARWDKAQTNDTTDRDSEVVIKTMENNAFVDAMTLTSDGKAILEQQMMIVEHEETAGTDGPGCNTGSFEARPLTDTRYNEIPDASLGSGGDANRIILPKGKFLIEATAVTYEGRENRLRIENITAGSTAILGLSVRADTGVTETSTTSTLKGVVTIATAGEKLELQQICQSGSGQLGKAASLGVPEIYARVVITRLK